MQERLNKYIASSGVCSRRKADEYISKGLVKVNSIVVTELGSKVNKNDIVSIDEKVISKLKDKKYILINKPVGYVTTLKEQFNRPCVMDLIKEEDRVYPVGRLDMFSEGMLLLTNDGDFVNKIIHPRSHVCKTYEVQLNKEIVSEDILRLKNGVDIGGYVTKPAKVEKIDSKIINITISEGKNKQVRKMCGALGYKVIKLKRVKIGALELGDLSIGDYVYLTEKEIQKIFEQ